MDVLVRGICGGQADGRQPQREEQRLSTLSNGGADGWRREDAEKNNRKSHVEVRWMTKKRGAHHRGEKRGGCHVSGGGKLGEGRGGLS